MMGVFCIIVPTGSSIGSYNEIKVRLKVDPYPHGHPNQSVDFYPPVSISVSIPVPGDIVTLSPWPRQALVT